MKRILVVAAFVFAALGAICAQERSGFTPSGKASAKLFTNFHTYLDGRTEGKEYDGFDLTRAYFGYQYQMTEAFSGKILLDVGNPKNGSTYEMTAYLKNAFVQYKESGLTVQFGLIGTSQFKTQENAWGYRYIAKSFQDEYKFGSSADLGLKLAYKFCDKISADVDVLNGEGYKKLQSDSIFKYGIGLTFEPVEGLTVRGYADFMGTDTMQTTITAFAGYVADKFSIGAEYNKQLNHKMFDGNDIEGYSVYGTYSATDKLGVFARYDDFKEVESKVIAGLEYHAAKGVKIAPNFQMKNPEGDGDDVISAYLNLEIKF